MVTEGRSEETAAEEVIDEHKRKTLKVQVLQSRHLKKETKQSRRFKLLSERRQDSPPRTMKKGADPQLQKALRAWRSFDEDVIDGTVGDGAIVEDTTATRVFVDNSEENVQNKHHYQEQIDEHYGDFCDRWDKIQELVFSGVEEESRYGTGKSGGRPAGVVAGAGVVEDEVVVDVRGSSGLKEKFRCYNCLSAYRQSAAVAADTDEKIKLWLFLPGRHSSVVETAQPFVCRLRVVASGLWLAPGDSEEVAAALSQALRSRIERALLGLCYMRFGDVFSKFHQFQSEELFRYVLAIMVIKLEPLGSEEVWGSPGNGDEK
ncbi:hypothetical protein V8G54_026813 [Vigna mungo]|uniref:Mediator of RNA polymerase II transcription subunit 13 n=1 Tax=Vigna mungo TaxID=3915 RepID=A0AAQ3RMH2_VIGMU